jgi:hypothetical protein
VVRVRRRNVVTPDDHQIPLGGRQVLRSRTGRIPGPHRSGDPYLRWPGAYQGAQPALAVGSPGPGRRGDVDRAGSVAGGRLCFRWLRLGSLRPGSLRLDRLRPGRFDSGRLDLGRLDSGGLGPDRRSSGGLGPAGLGPARLGPAGLGPAGLGVGSTAPLAPPAPGRRGITHSRIVARSAQR